MVTINVEQNTNQQKNPVRKKKHILKPTLNNKINAPNA
jgi:hypothetical protein